MTKQVLEEIETMDIFTDLQMTNANSLRDMLDKHFEILAKMYA
jgi:hypothetical protein